MCANACNEFVYCNKVDVGDLEANEANFLEHMDR
jgi:hypothetical protein